MLPCKKILCPTDFSETSFEALKSANEMASHFSAELILVHVLPFTYLPPGVLGMPGFNLSALEQQEMETAKKKLGEITQHKVPKEIHCRQIVTKGDAGHEILQIAAKENVDLIVIATHGMTGWRHYIYGSVAQRVIQHTPCSVLVIRYSGHDKQ